MKNKENGLDDDLKTNQDGDSIMNSIEDSNFQNFNNLSGIAKQNKTDVITVPSRNTPTKAKLNNSSSKKKKSNKEFAVPMNRPNITEHNEFNINIPINSPVSNSNSIKIAKTLEAPNQNGLTPEEKEYLQLKELYKKVKSDIEANPTEVNSRLKKKIKKRIKEIKEAEKNKFK
jgi:hypothetical protein